MSGNISNVLLQYQYTKVCCITGQSGITFVVRSPLPYFLSGNNILRTSAVSSTILRSKLIFASCVVGACSFFSFFFSHFYFPLSGRAVVTGVIPSPRRFLPSIFIAHRVQQSHCSSIFRLVLLSHALALSASQFVHKKKSQRIYTSMHSAGLELTKLTYTRLGDNLIRHRGDRCW